MSERLFSFLLSELKTMRIICKNPNCGSVLEIPLSRMQDKSGTWKCSVCCEPIQSNENHLAKLAQSILDVQKDKLADVGFALREGDLE